MINFQVSHSHDMKLFLQTGNFTLTLKSHCFIDLRKHLQILSPCKFPSQLGDKGTRGRGLSGSWWPEEGLLGTGALSRLGFSGLM